MSFGAIFRSIGPSFYILIGVQVSSLTYYPQNIGCSSYGRDQTGFLLLGPLTLYGAGVTQQVPRKQYTGHTQLSKANSMPRPVVWRSLVGPGFEGRDAHVSLNPLPVDPKVAQAFEPFYKTMGVFKLA